MYSGVPQLRAAKGQVQETCAPGAGREGTVEMIIGAIAQAHVSSCMPPRDRGSAVVCSNDVQLYQAVLCHRVTPWVEWLSSLLKTITAASSRAELNGQVTLKSFVFQAALLLVCACQRTL